MEGSSLERKRCRSRHKGEMVSSMKSTELGWGLRDSTIAPRGFPVSESIDDMALYSSVSGTQWGGYLKRACRDREPGQGKEGEGGEGAEVTVKVSQQEMPLQGRRDYTL
mmetsp:Transcript_24810/g.69132  ORF Transcript_24810/g.69132 Transcript_24810/m.69132 type:complete len:109 (-) Transcript_24810:1538-1864(-)